MPITATFSNGYSDTYKGDRDVRAAWAILIAGKVVNSGHSLDAARARKTAEGNTRYHISQALGRPPVGDSYRPTRYAQQIAYHNAEARKRGFANWKAAHAAWQADAAAARAMMTIEIIEL